MPGEFECQTAEDMLASFLKAGAVHSSACTAAFTKGCQMNPLTLAELKVEIVNICESWMKGGARDCPWQCWIAMLLEVLIYGTSPDHLWKHVRTWYCWHTSNTNWFSSAYKSGGSLTYATPCWMGGFEPPSTGVPMPPTPAQLGCTLPCPHHRVRWQLCL